jgi:hypothetical protein
VSDPLASPWTLTPSSTAVDCVKVAADICAAHAEIEGFVAQRNADWESLDALQRNLDVLGRWVEALDKGST